MTKVRDKPCSGRYDLLQIITTVVPIFIFEHCTNELDDCGEHASHLTVLGFRTQGVTFEVTAAAFSGYVKIIFCDTCQGASEFRSHSCWKWYKHNEGLISQTFHTIHYMRWHPCIISYWWETFFKSAYFYLHTEGSPTLQSVDCVIVGHSKEQNNKLFVPVFIMFIDWFWWRLLFFLCGGEIILEVLSQFQLRYITQISSSKKRRDYRL